MKTSGDAQLFNLAVSAPPGCAASPDGGREHRARLGVEEGWRQMLAFPAAVCTDDASAAAAPRPAEDDSWTLKTTKEVPLEETICAALSGDPSAPEERRPRRREHATKRGTRVGLSGYPGGGGGVNASRQMEGDGTFRAPAFRGGGPGIDSAW